MRTVLQVPMSVDLRTKATEAAEEMGFSSLQEVVRVLLNKLSAGRLSINVEDNVIPLSLESEKRYLKIKQDFKKNKDIGKAKNVEDLMKQFNGD